VVKIYGATTIGPYCKVGGEISNSIFQAYSNKGHDGFLGNSLVGEWCNFGADTNSSNLKNNYGMLKIFNYNSKKLEQTDVMFCGVMMGDHSKTGINTMLNTATTIGVSANIFGSGFPPKYIPSFSWGGFENSPVFKLDKAFDVAKNMMSRRNIKLSAKDIEILTHIFENKL
jgi:UDP-N-acetylglucosamine diphosphorylase/glucosamine-1-phosphate N-acetyltransferase